MQGNMGSPQVKVLQPVKIRGATEGEINSSGGPSKKVDLFLLICIFIHYMMYCIFKKNSIFNSYLFFKLTVRKNLMKYKSLVIIHCICCPDQDRLEIFQLILKYKITATGDNTKVLKAAFSFDIINIKKTFIFNSLKIQLYQLRFSPFRNGGKVIGLFVYNSR